MPRTCAAEPPAPAWLADALAEALASVPGSPEREHVLALLRRARRVRLGDDVARAAAETVRHACCSIERNLDHLLLGAPATWLEYGHAPRAAAFSGDAAVAGQSPRTVGCLLACNPDRPSQVAIFVAWQFASGAIHHAYALLHWDRAAFLRLAAAAPGRDDGGAPGRLLAAVTASVPPGLMAELEIWQGHDAADGPRREAALLRTRRDATGEHLFLLAATMLIESSAVVLLPSGPGGAGADAWEARLAFPSRRWPWRLWRRRGGGFRVAALGSRLAWSPPGGSVATSC